VRRLCDQLLKDMPWDVLTVTQLFEQNRIALGALNHMQDACIGETGTIVLGDRAHNLSASSDHKLVGQLLAERLSVRDR
jgi:hypothetical protein